MEFNYKDGQWLQYRNLLHKNYSCMSMDTNGGYYVSDIFIHTPVLTLMLHS